MSEDLDSTWERLLENAPPPHGLTRRRVPPDKFAIYAALAFPGGLPALQIEVSPDSLSEGTVRPESRGFELTVEPLTEKKRVFTRLTLHLLEESYQDLFRMVARDVYNRMVEFEDEKAMVAAMLRRLHSWILFAGRGPSSRLTDQEQTGLWGELRVMMDLVEPAIGPERAIHAWVGPDAANQDFESRGTAIEVKTTTSALHDRLQISNTRQLERTGLENLYLVHIGAAVQRNSGESLPEIVRQVRMSFATSPEALAELDDKLIRAGYADADEEYYRTRCHTCCRCNCFGVVDEFPCLLDSDLPQGVGDVKYTLMVSALSPFLASEDAVAAQLKAGEDAGNA